MYVNRYILARLVSLIFLSLSFLPAAGQHGATDTVLSGNWSIGARYYAGSFIVNQPKSEYLRDSYTSLGELFLEKQTNGGSDWHVSHRYPSIGMGFVAGNPGSKKYIGNLYALYPYIRFPVIAARKYEASIRTGGGLAMIGKPYDVYTNPKNTLLGTKFNVFLNFSFDHAFRITDQLHLNAGIGIMHISNGSTKLPNLGLNIPNINLGLRINLSKPVLIKRELNDTGSSKIDFAVYTSVSVKQYPWVGGSYYLINAMQLEAAKRIRRNYSLGAGILLLYNRTLRRYIMEDRPDNPSYNKFQAGLYLSYEHFLGRLSIPVNLGAYIYNGSSSGIFQQYGIRFRATPHLSTQILLKSNGGQADFIHIGAGYNF